MPTDSSSPTGPSSSPQRAPRFHGVRSWVLSAIFLWALIGAVAIAAFSSRETGSRGSQLALSPAPETLEKPASTTAIAPDSSVVDAVVAASSKKSSAGIQWETDFDTAMRRARLENKPIMVDFYTDWCSVCKMFDREVAPDPGVIAESRKWIAIKINGEKRPDVAGAYGVTGYPTIVFAAKSGKPVAILPGMAPAPEFVKIMRDARSKI